MATEAQRLIGLSLAKIAQSRTHRGGVSLHKNLLVATVLQKARYVFMEEAYNMVQYQSQSPRTVPDHQQQQQQQDHLVALTAEEADAGPCARCSNDKENRPPEYHPSAEVTYLDLDLDKSDDAPVRSNSCLKRRRAVSEWETEEAVQSILPKRSRADHDDDDSDSDTDNVFLDEASSSMEIDRITSLVSIFSFGMTDGGKLSRSVSTPDLCSAQAKDAVSEDTLQQRQFLAMTV